jgi:hypothetical protein
LEEIAMLKLLATAAALCFLGSTAHAVIIPWTAALDQAQEVPTPVAVPGAGGSASGTIDTVTGDLAWMVTFSGISGPATGLHFHDPAAPGATAGVQVNIGNISGLNSPSNGSAIITIAQVGELLAGDWYINLHTQLNGSGEIRGQVDAVPVPAALPLMLAGMAALGVVAHRRKRQA